MEVMTAPADSYRFRSVWDLPAGRDAAYDVLQDLGGYAGWWPQVRSVERYDDASATLVIRSALPYSLRVHATRSREDRAGGVLEARLDGDLEGWSRWTVTDTSAGCAAVFEEQVVVQQRQLRRLGRVARPFLRLNHAWMMLGGRRGLRRRLADG